MTWLVSAGAARLDGEPDAERLARVTLSRLSEPGDERLGGLVDDLGPAGTLAALQEGRLGEVETRRFSARLPGVDAAADLGRAARLGARLLCPGDAEWPSAVDDLGAARPLVLWVRGAGDLAALTRRSVAVVGARASTAYGEHVAGELAAVVCERGWTVVSGAAFGIDAAAHRGALAVGSPTVAVLACGVDVAYPRGHAGLLQRIVAEGGLVVSEHAPGTGVTRGRFLSRNRVIAALARGTVVVEAAARSGALSTAGRARDLDRFVMAVPGPVTSAASAGCHHLLREDPEAVLVTDGADVLDLVGDLGDDAAPARRGPVHARDRLGPDAARVLDALPRRAGAGVDAVVRGAGLDVVTVLRCLAGLEAQGLAEPHGGGWRVTEEGTR